MEFYPLIEVAQRRPAGGDVGIPWRLDGNNNLREVRLCVTNDPPRFEPMQNSETFSTDHNGLFFIIARQFTIFNETIGLATGVPQRMENVAVEFVHNLPGVIGIAA